MHHSKILYSSATLRSWPLAARKQQHVNNGTANCSEKVNGGERNV